MRLLEPLLEPLPKSVAVAVDYAGLSGGRRILEMLVAVVHSMTPADVLPA